MYVVFWLNHTYIQWHIGTENVKILYYLHMFPRAFTETRTCGTQSPNFGRPTYDPEKGTFVLISWTERSDGMRMRQLAVAMGYSENKTVPKRPQVKTEPNWTKRNLRWLKRHRNLWLKRNLQWLNGTVIELYLKNSK